MIINFILLFLIIIILCYYYYFKEKKIVNFSDQKNLNDTKSNQIIFDYTKKDILKSDDLMKNENKNVSLEKSSQVRKFITNLSSWYGNTWIDSIDENGKPLYKSSNNNIYNSEILVNKDVENINFLKLEENNKNKSIYNIYDSLIQDYKI